VGNSNILTQDFPFVKFPTQCITHLCLQSGGALRCGEKEDFYQADVSESDNLEDGGNEKRTLRCLFQKYDVRMECGVIGLISTGISSVEPWSSVSNDSSDPRCNQSELGYRILSTLSIVARGGCTTECNSVIFIRGKNHGYIFCNFNSFNVYNVIIHSNLQCSAQRLLYISL
jgi:hypothetical protein